MATGASTSAPTPVELVLYHVRGNGIIQLGVLEGLLPEATLQGGVGYPIQGGVGNSSLQGVSLGVGLYFALSKGGDILDLASLSPMEEEEEEVVVEEAVVEEEEEVVVESSVEEEEEEEESSMEEEEESSVEDEEVARASMDEEEEEEESSMDEEEEEEESSMEEEEESSVEDEEVARAALSVQVRIWLHSKHAIIILFDDGRWRLTKAYSIKWMRTNEEQLMLNLIDKGNNHQITSSSLKGCLSKLDFEGPLFYSNDLEEIIEKEANPSMDCFTVNNLLGKGATSKVYQCSFKKSSKYAVKIIKATRRYDIGAYDGSEPREIKIMSGFNDSIVPTFYQAWSATETYLDEENGGCLNQVGSYYLDEGSFESEDSDFDVYIHIHMELCSRTLRDTLAFGEYKIDIEEGLILFENIAKAVNSIHQMGVIHRDLKPENIYIGHNGEIKLGDFGDSCWVSSYLDGQDGSPDRGSEQYMAPELDGGKVSTKVDIYSMGIMYLEIFHAFKTGGERQDVLDVMKKGQYPKDWIGDTEFLKKLVALCPIERASMNDILGYIERRKNSPGK